MKTEQDTDVTSEEIEQTLGIENKNQKTTWPKIIAYALAAILLSLAGYWVWHQFGGTDIPDYVMGEVTRGDLTLTVSATGNLEAVNTVEVGSEISGLIESVFVDYNDRVTEGELLAQIDTDRLEAEVAQAEASLQAAEAALTQARASFLEQQNTTERARQLAERNLISDQELETTQAALTRAEANVASARAQVVVNQAALNMAQTTLSKAYIRSPIDGVVLTSDIKPGQAVAASFQTPVLFTLAEDLTRMELHVDIDEADISQVVEGQEASFTVDTYPDTTFPATITKVYYAAQIESGVVTYETILSVDNSGMLLRPGMTATVEIITDQVEDALLVPNSALRFTPPTEQGISDDEDRVWIRQDGSLFPIPVKAGKTDNLRTQILEGDVQVGQQVIINIKREE